MNPATLKQWLARGELEKLEHVVLEGRGARLLGEHSPDLRTRVFLKALPNFLTKISQIHEATARGALSDVRKLAASEPKKKLALAKDASGTPLVHKAVINDRREIVEWLIENYPTSVRQKDREGRTALHYCSACEDPESMWDLLIEAGCDSSVCDKSGNSAAHYLTRGAEIRPPADERTTMRKDSSGSGGGGGAREHLDFKPSNVRIWIHNRDIGKLQRVVWEGHGSKLRVETSNNPRVRKFLEATPFIMDTIKAIHGAVVKNDLEAFRKKVAAPVLPIVLRGKDANGLSVLHKAAGLGYAEMAGEIADRCPATLDLRDNDGRTALHYAAAVAKDDGRTYDLLIERGADEKKLDNKQRTASYYKSRPSELDLAALTVVPDAPRVSGSYPKNWDWRILESDEPSAGAVRKARSGLVLDVDRAAFGSPETASKNGDAELDDFEIGGGSGDNVRAEEPGEPRVPPSPSVGTPPPLESESAERVQDKGDGDEKLSDDDAAVVVVADNDDDDVPDAGENDWPKTEDAEDVPRGTTAVEETIDPGATELKKRGEEREGRAAEEDDGENGAQEEEEEEEEEEERNDPSTGDSGVDELRSEDDQVIVGKHAESPENELDEGSSTTDPEVDELLENGGGGGMEQLAALVLNGEGRRLVGRRSKNPELQAFIDNVPAYMGKIHAVHMAAREGNLRDLQSSLDRRKFATARDGSSPHGASPLHVAVIFGHTAIVRYLGGRFPETTNALDTDGRTPLHYAATLADNGHYYNLLLHLGANPLVRDNFGQKADHYRDNRSDLSHKRLLRDFGAREKMADEMLTDKDDSGTETAIFRPEEGRYLASSLGDPLMKGLAEVANARPDDPVAYLATYLYNFARKSEKASAEGLEESNVLVLPRGKRSSLDARATRAFGNEDDEDDEDEKDGDDANSKSPESTYDNSNRDEHGQSVLHFTAVRTHPIDGLLDMLRETRTNVAYRDELYRTARDVADESGIAENVRDIDRWVVHLAARGETDKLIQLLLDGYDHILDAEDGGINIVDIAAERNREATVLFLQSISHFLAQRDELQSAARAGDLDSLVRIFERNGTGGTLLAVGKNTLGRCALHVAVLAECADVVEYIAKNYPDTLRIGDNIERTALHYAMGVPSVEILSGILIRAGAKRVHKDLKSRQPSYYFMNKTDILRLQEEEETIARSKQA